jgi:hypothetical protein
MRREYDPDLNVRDNFFKRLHPSIREGILLKFLDLVYNLRCSKHLIKKSAGIAEIRITDPITFIKEACS